MLLRAVTFLGLGLCLSAAGETDHWAYRAPQAVELPPTGHPVDTLLRASWSELGLQPAPLAEPGDWLRRAAYTLTGLPPTDEQLQRLAAHPDDQTWRALVDEFLATPAYGERWARHWMDVARYADTMGYNFDKDNRFPYAYTYRDWLIRAFNDDLPYDRFIKFQVAGDLLVDRPDHPDVAALGFLTVGRRVGGVEMIDDRVDVLTRGFLSTTVACARCHDHKTDPIAQEDYYSLYSIIENTHEHQPIIGRSPDEAANAAFEAEKAKLEEQDRAVKQAMIDQMRSQDTLATYLELGWLAKTENWDHGRASAEGFRRGRYRPTAILRWRGFLEGAAWGEGANARLAGWVGEMEHAEDRAIPCAALATEWIAAFANGGDLAELAKDGKCPLSYDVHRIHEFYDQQDGNEQRERDSAMARLEVEHPGAPPRAMSLRDRDQFAPAQVFRRGSPGDRAEPFERHWLGILGGEPFAEGKSPRLALAERLADRNNPLTARTMVNRVWNWHFGGPLADPGDFGPQSPAPVELALLDWLAVWFMDHGWSVKELHRFLLSSQAFRLAADGPADNDLLDEANTRFWKWNRRRLDFESMRDHLLATAGCLETEPIGGRSVNLLSADADRRRSVYGFVDRYALPGLFVNFDVPHPDHHAPKRLETTVPQQALYFLNNDLPIRHAARLAGSQEFQSQADDEARVRWIYQGLYQRPPVAEEIAEALAWIHSATADDYAPLLSGHWEVRYRADDGSPDLPLQSFPLLKDGRWQTGEELSSAPVPWLSAAAGGGHASQGHALVLRWRAHGSGEVKLTGSIQRSQKDGHTLAWHLAGPDGQRLQGADLPPEASATLETPWTAVHAGQSIDFVLRAPEGHNCGGVNWTLRIIGREDPQDPEQALGSFNEQFPQSNEAPPLPPSGDPWADLIQVLWASNEFHFLD